MDPRTDKRSKPYREPRRLTLCGYFGFGNLGDEAILISMILSYTYDDKLLNVLINPSAVSEYKRWLEEEGLSSSVRLFNRWSPLQVLRALLSSDGLVLGGGGLLQDETSLRSLAYYASVGLMAKALGRRLFISRQSIGPLHRDISKLIVRLILRLADEVTVRDSESLKLAKALGCPDPKLEDDWTYEERFRRWLNEEVEVKNVSYPILWILRRWPLSQESLEALSELVRSFEAYSEFLAFQQEDVRIYELIGISPDRVFTYRGGPRGLREVLRKIRDAKLIVSMRLHGVILAQVLSKEVIALSYSPKVSWLARDKGIPSVEVNDPSEVRGLREMILRALDER